MVLYLESYKVPDVSEKVHVSLVNCLLWSPPTVLLTVTVRSEQVILHLIVLVKMRHQSVPVLHDPQQLWRAHRRSRWFLFLRAKLVPADPSIAASPVRCPTLCCQTFSPGALHCSHRSPGNLSRLALHYGVVGLAPVYDGVVLKGRVDTGLGKQLGEDVIILTLRFIILFINY